MLRESFDVINDHLERLVPGTSPPTVQISSADESSAPYAYVSSGSSSSSSTCTNNTDSSTTSSIRSSDQEEDDDIIDKVGTHINAIANENNLHGKNTPSKSDVASSTDNDTDETAESSHDDQNVHDTGEESEDSHSEDDEVEGGEESESEESFADDAYIQTDEVTLSVSDLDRLRSLRPHGGGIKTTIPTKRTASCMKASDIANEKKRSMIPIWESDPGLR